MNIIKFEEVDSTNTTALKMAADGFPAPCIIMTQTQTHGRGKLKRKWYDKPGESLLMSIILEPNRPVWEYSFRAGVASIILKNKYNIDIKLKWVNDIYLNDKKLGGILCESCVYNNIPRIIIGIGINILNTDFNNEIADIATSIYINKPHININKETLAQEIAQEILKLEDKDIEYIISLWRQNMWGKGKPVTVKLITKTGTKEISGIIDDITNQGELKLNNGIINAGEIID